MEIFSVLNKETYLGSVADSTYENEAKFCSLACFCIDKVGSMGMAFLRGGLNSV